MQKRSLLVMLMFLSVVFGVLFVSAGCVGQVTGCSAMTYAQCGLQDGCGWNDFIGCIGAATSCASYSNATSCGSQYGCNWQDASGEGTCTGTVDCLSYSSSSLDCPDSLGCNWNGHICSGSPTCPSSYDSTSCSNIANCSWTPSSCGDNVINTGEECDGTALNGEDCTTQGFTGGTLSCLADCTGYDDSACTGGTCTNGETQLCALQQGVCSGSQQICSGSAWPGCAGVYSGITGYNETETGLCSDGVDNDCDGLVDSLDGSDCYGECPATGFDFDNPFLDIKSISGITLAVLDHSGMVAIRGDLKDWSTAYSSTDFLIKDSGGSVVSWLDSTTGDLYLSGGVNTEVLTSPSSSGNLVIKDSPGNSVAWFDSFGNLETKSCLATAIPPFCGDGIINQPSEECDINDFGGQSCLSLSYDFGLLSCTDQCTIDSGGCSNSVYPDAPSLYKIWQDGFTCTGGYYEYDVQLNGEGATPVDNAYLVCENTGTHEMYCGGAPCQYHCVSTLTTPLSGQVSDTCYALAENSHGNSTPSASITVTCDPDGCW